MQSTWETEASKGGTQRWVQEDEEVMVQEHPRALVPREPWSRIVGLFIFMAGWGPSRINLHHLLD